MTHPTYTQQALSRYTLPRLKRIATELGITPTGDKRAAETWINAIIAHQSTQLQKVDNQALAQAELDNYIADQAQAIAPEPLTIVEISFSDYEYYADDKLIARISHDNNHLTQRWVVMVNDKEVFRANTLMRCDRFICNHYSLHLQSLQRWFITCAGTRSNTPHNRKPNHGAYLQRVPELWV